jgi:hypothetical protein
VGTPAHSLLEPVSTTDTATPSAANAFGDLSLDTCVPCFVLGGQKLNVIFALNCLHARPFQPLCGNSRSPLAVQMLTSTPAST